MMRSTGRGDLCARRECNTSRRLAVCYLAVALCVGTVAGGCGPDTGGRVAVSGTVKFRGEPLKQGTIEFTAQDGKSQSGGTITEGKFALPAVQGLRVGQYLVRISSVQGGTAPAGPPGPESMTPQGKDVIPLEYNVKSTLTAEVTKGGPNKFDFDLK